MLGKIRDKQLSATEEAVTLVLESLDNIKALIDHLSEHGSEPEGDDSDIISRLNHFADTGQVKGSGDAPVASATPAAEAVETPADDAAEADAGAGDFSHFFKGDDELNALIAEKSGSKPLPPMEECLLASRRHPAPKPVEKKRPPGRKTGRKSREIGKFWPCPVHPRQYRRVGASHANGE